VIDEAIRLAVAAALAQELPKHIGPLLAEVQALRATAAPQMLSIAQAAQRLGVSICSVRRRVADGSIPAQRVGRRLVVPADAAALRPKDPAELARLAREAQQ
jgi:excisionase family DNA binding protein